MKTTIIAAVAAAVVGLSAGTAFAANDTSRGFAVQQEYRDVRANAPAANDYTGSITPMNDRAPAAAVQTRNPSVSGNGEKADDFRATQTWGR